MEFNDNISGGVSTSFKVYLFRSDDEKPEVRRFAIKSLQNLLTFNEVCNMIRENFPTLSDKPFTVSWKDDDNDNVIISSDSELKIALHDMKDEIKKLYVHLIEKSSDLPADGVLHEKVVCDECDKNIRGIRYKCIACFDYDLCSSCEKLGAHPEHPMLRISHPHMFDPHVLRKLLKILSSFTAHKIFEGKHRCHGKKRHCAENFGAHAHQKKESGKHEESGSESDNHKSSSKSRGEKKRCKNDICKHLLGEYMQYFSPFLSEFEANKKKEGDDTKKSDGPAADEEPPHIKYLNNIGKTISSLLDPLGIDVDFEVRPSTQQDKKETRRSDPDIGVSESNKQSSSNNVNNKNQKKVHFETAGQNENDLTSKVVNEMADILVNQKITDNSTEKDDWVSYEQLKADADVETHPTTTGAIPKKTSQQTESMMSQNETGKQETSSGNQTQNLYPNLNEKPLEPHIRQAMEKMIGMGFTNEGGWLVQLLEAKNGDIDQALKVITGI